MYLFSIVPGCVEGNGGITNWELDDALLGKPLDRMNGCEVEAVRNGLIDHLARAVLYTAAIPAADAERWRRFFLNAHLIHVQNVLLSWPCIDGAEEEDLRRIIALGRSFSIRVLFKLEAAHMDAFDLDRYEALRSEDTGLYYDPAEIVSLGKRPFHDVLYKCRVKDDVVFFRIHERTQADFAPQLPGQGQSQIKECTSNLMCRNMQGYFSFVPYGTDMPKTIQAFQAMLRRM